MVQALERASKAQKAVLMENYAIDDEAKVRAGGDTRLQEGLQDTSMSREVFGPSAFGSWHDGVLILGLFLVAFCR